MTNRGGIFGVLAAAVLAALPGVALAQAQRIGAASSVQNSVSRISGGATNPLSVGGSVFRNETVATGAASSARLTFLDETNLSIGPTSRVLLNHFVYSENSSAQALAVNLARGAFRFSSGALDVKAYKINTPTATIGVRGTIVDLFISAGRTVMTMVEGQATGCTASGRQCTTVREGETLIIDASGVHRSGAGGTRFSFQQYCTASAGLCGNTQFARHLGIKVLSDGTVVPVGATVQELEDALCGR
ncbi:FecR domain-containing protein [Roseiarcaceae bacterium H3SJ34-1]|uniref:FecR family protein n=1 Tax=Terripilifer ovatus TaxID=3032367 RepID=UPI003AB9A055|nr:FecR domain-containing protein [Roseiarcaceae bacterium H3SJ34-1]